MLPVRVCYTDLAWTEHLPRYITWRAAAACTSFLNTDLSCLSGLRYDSVCLSAATARYLLHMSQGSTASELIASLDRALAGILPLTDILEPSALQRKGTPALFVIASALFVFAALQKSMAPLQILYGLHVVCITSLLSLIVAMPCRGRAAQCAGVCSGSGWAADTPAASALSWQLPAAGTETGDFCLGR